VSTAKIHDAIPTAARVHRFTYAIRNIVAEALKVEAAGKRMSTDMDGKEGKYRFVRYIERTEGIKIIGTAAK